jgi:hypothetical protein
MTVARTGGVAGDVVDQADLLLSMIPAFLDAPMPKDLKAGSVGSPGHGRLELPEGNSHALEVGECQES